jgi:hypothetical protein
MRARRNCKFLSGDGALAAKMSAPPPAKIEVGLHSQAKGLTVNLTPSFYLI